jgi:phosphoribosylformylglycinamidine cyclo-ligase
MYNTTKPYIGDIESIIQSTWPNPEDGPFPRWWNGEWMHTDGCGTKGIFYLEARKFRELAQDVLAANLNDEALVGRRVVKITDTIVLPRDDHEAIISTVKSLAEECAQSGIALLGGETEIDNTIRGMRLNIATYSLPQIKNWPNICAPGDVLVGVPSSGLHCNGFTLVRELLGPSLRQEYLIPTRMYADALLSLYEASPDSGKWLHGRVHVAGGAFTRLRKLLPPGVYADINHLEQLALAPPPIFRESYRQSQSDEQMYKTFNCGVGLILSCARGDVPRILRHFPDAAVFGAVLRKAKTNSDHKLFVRSAFSDRTVLL